LAHTVPTASLQAPCARDRVNGVDNEWLTPEEAKAFCPLLSVGQHPLSGTRRALHRRGGNRAPHAVAWGLRARRGCARVDIIGTGSDRHPRDATAQSEGVETTRGTIRARIGVAAAGHTSVIMNNGRFDLPLESYRCRRWCPTREAGVRAWSCPHIHAYIASRTRGSCHRRGTEAYTRIRSAGAAYHQPCAGGDLRSCSHVSPLRMLRAWAASSTWTPTSPSLPRHRAGAVRDCGWGTGGFQPRRVSAHVFAWTSRAMSAPDQSAVHPGALPRRSLIDEAARRGATDDIARL